jgi:alanine racemase
MVYSIQHIARVLGAELLNAEPHERGIAHLATDSRRLLYAAGTLFFAIKGPRRDGHDFIDRAYDAGVRDFVVGRHIDISPFSGANFLLTPDVVGALQALAIHHRRRFSLPVIGITGSNGKTIVKEWLFQLLREDFHLVRSPGSYNSQIGVPLSVWQIATEHELGIFEAGISRMGEMARLAPIIDCQVGVLTNIGEAHSEGFPSKRKKLEEKLQLFQSAEVIIYRADDPMVDEALRRLGKPLLSWGFRRSVDLEIIEPIEYREDGARIEGRYRGRMVRAWIPFSDPASAENAIHCWAVSLYLGLDPDRIGERMRRLEQVAMRLELGEGINGCVVINDSYNNDISGLTQALQFLSQQARDERRVLILSDILESGRDAAALYREVAQLLARRPVRRFFGIGPEIRRLASFLSPGIEAHYYPDTDAFLAEVDKLHFHQETILLKGARPFAFERIGLRLTSLAHQTVLEINLSAMADNLRVYQRFLAPETRLMVMVKASAYGGGSLEVAHFLARQGVNYLAVAYADEGVALRQGGVRLPILILNPEPAVFDLLVRFGLEPELYSPSILRRYGEYTAGRGGVFPAHIKLDTGMRRLGFDTGQLDALIDLAGAFPHLRVQSVFSHLAASEDPAHDAFTHEQAARFTAMYERLVEALGYRPPRHLLNTNGMVRFPRYQFDMVRLGIGIYGSDISGATEGALRPVFSLKTRIAQIKEVAPGETVGYGRLGAADHPRRVATIAIGYADGFRRVAGNGRYQVSVRGRMAPTVGNICMDVSMIDVTGIPEAREGDEVIIFAHSPSIEAYARAINSIPYEAATSISPRVKRVYVQE